MVSTLPLVFEGPDPEKLLIDAWSVHGTGVRISEPACVRKGGLFGFFQKLHYRIEVLPAVPEPPASRSTARAATQAPVTTASALERLVESTEDVFEVDGPPRRSFDEVLDGVASALGDDPATFAASGIAGLATAGALATEVVERETAGHEAPGAAREAAARRERSAVGRFDDPLGELRRLAAGEAGEAPAGERDFSAPGPPNAVGAPRAARETLDGLGFPRELVDRVPGRLAPLAAIDAACALLPAASPLPDVAGALIAVVGELGRALEIASTIIDDLGLDDAEIAVVAADRPGFAVPTHLIATDARTAAALSPGWRRDGVAVVAVGTGTDRASARWCRTVLHALRPTAAWAVVSAAAKPEDVACFAASAGGLDALVVDDLDATVTPAAVVRAGVPVARIGDAPATARRWSELLATRHAPDVPGER